VPFLTVTSLAAEANTPAHIELWFHPQPDGNVESVFVVRPVVAIYQDTSTGTGPPPDPPPGGAVHPTASSFHNVFTVPIAQLAKAATYLRIEVNADETLVASPTPTSQPAIALSEWIAKTKLRYVGWTPATGSNPATIVSFLRVVAAAR